MARLKPPSRPRPRRLPRLLGPALSWTVPALLVAGGVGVAVLSRVPAAQPVLDRVWTQALAATGSLRPVWAGVSMLGSSLLTLASSLRINASVEGGAA